MQAKFEEEHYVSSSRVWTVQKQGFTYDLKVFIGKKKLDRIVGDGRRDEHRA